MVTERRAAQSTCRGAANFRIEGARGAIFRLRQPPQEKLPAFSKMGGSPGIDRLSNLRSGSARISMLDRLVRRAGSSDRVSADLCPGAGHGAAAERRGGSNDLPGARG